MIYIGLDDTDNADSRGTGRLARDIAATLAKRYKVFAVTRHQLLVDPRVPYTSHNSCAALHLAEDGAVDLAALADQVQSLMLADWQDGSDPGLCVARVVEPAMTEFGYRAKRDVVRQADARAVAEQCGCILRGLGGTDDGVIGALAGVGLAVTGNDGRFLLIGRSRELQGVQPVKAILDYGIADVRTMEGRSLDQGLVDTEGKLRPAYREGRAILFVARHESDPSLWKPVKLD